MSGSRRAEVVAVAVVVREREGRRVVRVDVRVGDVGVGVVEGAEVRRDRYTVLQ